MVLHVADIHSESLKQVNNVQITNPHKKESENIKEIHSFDCLYIDLMMMMMIPTENCGVRCVHGTCENHLCHCNSGWAGQACDLRMYSHTLSFIDHFGNYLT
jgi:hypothetical protein